MDDLRHRLRRLGVTTGREFQTQPAAPRQRADIDTLVDGQALATADGVCYSITHSYEGGTPHGTHNLSEWLALRPETVAHVGQNGTLADTDPQCFIFLDTETTGLGGGAFAFLVGVGYFESGGFVVRQFFLRDPAEEAAMLGLLNDILAADTSLVTFNGRTFDVPLLAGRYILARKRSLIGSLPNLDLLHPSRRLWRRRLASCALSALEGDVLGVRRTHSDVPGSLIPYLYRQYLQTHDAHDMVRVLYHNEIDLLSMVSLAVRLCQAYDHPEANGRPVDDQLSLARWYCDQGQVAESEAAYRAAAAQAPDAESRYEALAGLAYLLKRADRRDEALVLWADLADLKFDTLGHEELAKHYEWQTHDLPLALAWTEQAIALAESWRPGLRRTEALRALTQRRERLLRKLSNQPGEADAAIEE